ncbi:MAG: hypothetical protein QW583_06410, partial [Sulfolobales archaeon]
VVTTVPVTQVREVTQVVGGTTVIMTQTEVRVGTLTVSETPPQPRGISTEALTLLAVLLVVFIGAIAFLATKRR